MQDKNIIAYALKQLKVPEKNYPIHDQELTTVVFVLKIRSHYLYTDNCEVFTEYHNLEHVFMQKDLNLRQQRKQMKLLKDYDVTI